MTDFWKLHPALLYALTLLIGTSSYLFWSFPCNYIWPFLWGCYLLYFRFWPAILLLFASIGYAFVLSPNPPSSTTGYFSISSLQPHQSPFQKSLQYKGTLYVDCQKLPCSVYYHGNSHPPANTDYILKGKLQQRDPYSYHFKAKEWIPVKNTYSPAELRYNLKERFRNFLHKKLKSANFLGSLITGDVEERLLRYQFGKLGLQHILAISGFHFAILIAFCSFFLSLFLSYRNKLLLLLFAVSAYFLFVGALPAVQRSWLTVLFYLIGKLTGRHSPALNLLGVSLLIEVLLNPLVSGELGFQLSFLSCAGILLYQPLIEQPLRRYLPTHEPHQLTFLSQHGYLLSSFLRQALSVTLAVNLLLLPLLLYHFHTFPLLSLLYNLFFPFLVGLSLFALLASLLFYTIFPPLGDLLLKLTDLFTLQLLDLIAYPPIALDYSLKISHLPAWLIPIYLFGLFYLHLFSKISTRSYGGRSSVG